MARLPVPGSDEGQWGQILNDYLLTAHSADGALKVSAIQSSALADGSITQAKLSAAGATSGKVLSTDGTNLTWATVGSSVTSDASVSSKGIIQLAGDLAGTAAAPTVPGLANKANTSHTHTASQISDSTNTGRSLIQAADAATARTIIGAGTSNLVIGTTNATAKAGDYVPTKTDIGLANVDNTSDANKPVSSAVTTALAGKANTSHSHAIADVTGLQTALNAKADSSTVPAQFTPIAGTNISLTGTYPNVTFNATPGAGVTDITVSRNATSVTVESNTGADGVIAVADGTNAGVLSASDKTKLDGIATGAQANTVNSVAGKTGAVTLTKTDVGLGNVDNTSDVSKPVSTAAQSALDAKADARYTINAQTSTAYTLVLGDTDRFITMANASASTLTVPTNAAVAFPIGTRITFVQMGAGQVTVVASGGVAVYSDPGLKIAAQYGGAELVKLATDTWILVGRLAA